MPIHDPVLPLCGHTTLLCSCHSAVLGSAGACPKPWYHADPLSRTKAACISLCFCCPPLPRTMRWRLLPHCSHYPAGENDSLVHGEGTGQKVNEQRLQLSHTKAQDGALSRAVGHPGKRERGRVPIPELHGDYDIAWTALGPR